VGPFAGETNFTVAQFYTFELPSGTDSFQGCPLTSRVFELIANLPRLDMLRWAVDHACPVTATGLSTLAAQGRLEMLQHLHEKGIDLLRSNLCSVAASLPVSGP
jgi:hypothetical protein